MTNSRSTILLKLGSKTLKQAEEPEPVPKERTMRVLKSAESRWIAEAGIRMFEETYSNEQRAARTRQGIIIERACYEEIVTQKRRYLSCQTSVLDFFKTISEIHASPPYFRTMQMMIQMIQEELSPPQIAIYLSVLTFFLKSFVIINTSFFLVKTDCLEPSSPF
jgi:hypothetical protein